MALIKIAGIMRAGVFSPNHIGNDAAIFNFVAEQLRKRGCEVNVYSEEQFIAGAVDEHIILNMCREMRSIELLQRREDAGDLVINSGYGIENCIRERMTRILLGSGIEYPESIIVNTDEAVIARLKKMKIDRCWIKRGESHSLHHEDVCYARHAEEAQELLQEFFLRGIKKAVINRHLDGELVKFYGVEGSPFFYTFYPFRQQHGKATDPGKPQADPEKIREMCEKAAKELDVKVYGGDCILSDDGSLSLIDINDWPSFAPCRQEAAPAIAKYVMSAIKEHNS